LIPNRDRRCSFSLFKQNRLGEGYSEIKPPSSRSGVGSGPIPQTLKSLSITETKDTMINIPDDCGYQVVGYMKSESLQEAWRRMQSHHTPDYYAALLPRRGPHIASHSVCPSVCMSVCLSVPLADVLFYSCTVLRANIQNRKTSVFAYGPASRMYFSARAEGRITYGHLGRTNSC